MASNGTADQHNPTINELLIAHWQADRLKSIKEVRLFQFPPNTTGNSTPGGAPNTVPTPGILRLPDELKISIFESAAMTTRIALAMTCKELAAFAESYNLFMYDPKTCSDVVPPVDSRHGKTEFSTIPYSRELGSYGGTYRSREPIAAYKEWRARIGCNYCGWWAGLSSIFVRRHMDGCVSCVVGRRLRKIEIQCMLWGYIAQKLRRKLPPGVFNPNADRMWLNTYLRKVDDWAYDQIRRIGIMES